MRVFPFIVASLVALPGALADPPPAPTSVVAVEDPSAHLHDGFYMRLATGFGSSFQTIAMEGHDPSVTVSGMSNVGELALGWAVWPGRILGLGWWSGTLVVTSREFHMDQPMPPDPLLNDAKDFNIFGPFADIYFNPRRGFHMQGALGLATVRGLGLTEARFHDDVVYGAGVMLGLGYEWWVSNQWSVGLLGRVTAASTVNDDQDGVTWVHAVGASPSLLFTATYN